VYNTHDWEITLIVYLKWHEKIKAENIRKIHLTGCQRPMPVILATQEAEVK
jgi:hypothetical protein